MDTERQIERENWLEAKAVVRQREDTFFQQIKDGIRYSALANAGAIAALIGFLGSAGNTLVSARPAIPAFGLFTLGLAFSGASIALAALIHRNNFSEALNTYIEAAVSGNLSLFNGTARLQDKHLFALYVVWSLSFAFFILGITAGIVAFFVVKFQPSTA
jgi:hypothetical protein